MSSYKSFSIFWREVVKDSMHGMISEKVECISGKIFGDGKKWQPRRRSWGKC